MQIEWLFLADAAEVLNNKLYVMGGGWESLQVHDAFPIVQHFAVAISVRLEPHEVNKSHEFALDIESPSGVLLATIEADFELVPEEGATGQHRWQFASAIDLEISSAGSHRVVVHLNGQEQARHPFLVESLSE